MAIAVLKKCMAYLIRLDKTMAVVERSSLLTYRKEAVTIKAKRQTTHGLPLISVWLRDNRRLSQGTGGYFFFIAKTRLIMPITNEVVKISVYFFSQWYKIEVGDMCSR